MTLQDLLAARLSDPCLPLLPSTVAHYRRCLVSYGRHLGRRPTLDDLAAAPLLGWARSIVADGKSPHTASQNLKQLRALWAWAFQEGFVAKGPSRGLKLTAPRVVPDSWSGDELARLFDAAGRQRGWIGPHKAADWWLGVLWYVWNTGARAGETWQVRLDHLDLQRGVVSVPASIRKESRVPMKWWLSRRGLEAVGRVAERSEGVLFTQPWQHVQGCYRLYRSLLRDAGLPVTRRNGLQRLRRTVSTRIRIRGGEPGIWLGHAPRTVAEEHYTDRWATQTALRDIWPTDELAEGLPPAGAQRLLFAA